MKIKICGMRRLEDIEIINKYKPDFVGIIFYPKSKRYVDLETAKLLVEKLDKNIKSVGVFVNEEADKINEILDYTGIDIAQLHGDESPEFCKKIKKEVWKAISVEDEKILDEIKKYKENISLILFDNGKGGTGKSFDWNLIKNLDKDLKIALAGGISADNIEKAMKEIKPNLIDVNSCVETDGFKDEEKIREIMKIFKNGVE